MSITKTRTPASGERTAKKAADELFHRIIGGDSPTAQTVSEVRDEKYAKGGEDYSAILARVARALAHAEEESLRELVETQFHEALAAGFAGGGRIMSAAGTDISATLINCFVNPVSDSWSAPDAAGRPGIGQALIESVETMRRGGGEGYNFSHVRPRGARVRGTRSRSSGPVSFMRIFDKGCAVVESAGARRGAQMGVLRADHPDIFEFIASKDIRSELARLDVTGLDWQSADALRGRLRELSKFNISVAVTHQLMQAVRADGDFDLVHVAEPDPREHPDAHQRADGLWVYRTVKARDLFQAIVTMTYETADPGVVFIDTVNDCNNLYYAETIETCNPCGEQFLPDYGCCDLGSPILSRFVLDPFTDRARLDDAALIKAVKTGVRMLDNVLDVTLWPLPQQRDEAMAKRRIGVGFTGLACAMAMLKIKYNSPQGVEFAEKVMKTICFAAYEASVELAQEKGPFPLFDADAYLNGAFVKKLPKKIRDSIAKHGIRNSHLLSIAPTGTISMAFGGNCSGGIEPNFANEFLRTKIMEDGSKQQFLLRPYSVLAYEALVGEVTESQPLPDYFVVTDDLTVDDHLQVQAVVQKWVDSAVSKTINCPVDMSLDAFMDVYLKAYDLGLKGCTTYKPNDVTGVVLSRVSESKTSEQQATDPDRRIRIEELPEPPLNSLRWPGRPELAMGNPSQTYMVEGGPDVRFSVMVGHIENGEKWPFEVWVNGAEQPRGLDAIAKLLSMDMRSNDRGFLALKLDALMRTSGHPITVALMPDGRNVPYPSPTAVMTKLVKYRCAELGAFDGEDRPTPVLDALMSKKEPDGGPFGTMAWNMRIKNSATGDKFEMFVKEVVLPDGSTRPISVWFAGDDGDYPRDYDGLTKLLSIDMRVVDVAWVAEKLRKLSKVSELKGDFLARRAGADKPTRYPSTLAYVADVLLHRYQVLGLLDDEGRPVTPLGVLAARGPTPPAQRDLLQAQVKPGRLCLACGASAVLKVGGCDLCTACGEQGSCG